MHPLVSVRGLCKSFAGVQALDQARFELRAGEVHALMGENGAGKSTLMKVLAGIHARDAGTIEVDGKPTDIDSPRGAQALGIGIVHQELNLMRHLSAAQNIFIGREPRRGLGLFLDEERLNADARKLFERLNLDLDPRTPVAELTVARQQMVEIAKALSFDSRVLIMDEPTAALNAQEVADLFRVIRQLRADGAGVIYISHRMDELQQIADRVTVMRDGRTIDTLALAETSVAAVIHMMVGRELEENLRATPPDTSTRDVALEVRHLQRGSAIRDVSFSVRRGEILGFAGLMGAGRTEVARAVFGADPVDGGEVLVHGRPARIRSPRDAVTHGIGYLSEDRKQFGLATAMDVQSNIAMSSLARLLRLRMFIDTGAVARTARGYVSRLGIRTPSVAQPVKLLSGGNQQKVVIAKWLLRDCDILFFDEPTRGIDVGAKAEIHKLIDALAAQGKAIVVISSELPEILRLAHRVVVMCEGRVTGELSGREATQESIMQLATRRSSTSLH
ncbi:MAG: sugar ABC transporter ATP-binding protein [Pseudomonadota bacterium]|nr:sugar ABC transporter ATP-binding protein [Pseudomonadota bacterium]